MRRAQHSISSVLQQHFFWRQKTNFTTPTSVSIFQTLFEGSQILSGSKVKLSTIPRKAIYACLIIFLEVNESIDNILQFTLQEKTYEVQKDKQMIHIIWYSNAEAKTAQFSHCKIKTTPSASNF
mmetsp:Transcript_25348/g.25801  ORF Transcript_25348/g.25801 Transcript_25348/m.25801 type:complete len:124 (-) Transcript_25348:204-575(-)